MSLNRRISEFSTSDKNKNRKQNQPYAVKSHDDFEKWPVAISTNSQPNMPYQKLLLCRQAPLHKMHFEETPVDFIDYHFIIHFAICLHLVAGNLMAAHLLSE